MKHKTILIAMAALMLAGCNKYDDSALLARMAQAEQDIKKLQERVDGLNQTLTGLSTIVDALKTQDKIVSVTKLDDDSGYVVEFSQSGKITLYNGKNGIDGTNGTNGTDGTTPTIGVKLDTDGNYYWTVNGEYLLDDKGNKISATAHITTPKIRINEGNFEISYNNGETWEVIGTAGSTGDVVFSKVEDGAEAVTFTLADGTTIVIPKVQQFAISVNTDVIMSAGETASVSYTVTAADEGTVVDAFGTKGFEADVMASSYSAGIVMIKAPNPLTNGKVYIIAVKSDGTTAARILSCEEGVFQLDETAFAAKVPAAGGTVEIPFRTNLENPMVMVDPAFGWITYVETRAVRNGTIVFSVAENTAEEERSGVVIINMQRYTIVQEGKSSAPVTGGGSADLNTINNGANAAAISTYSTANGWIAATSRVLNHSSRFDDIEGPRPVICARSDKNGTLTSPILSGGCGTVTVDYYRAMTKIGSNFTIEIKSSDGNTVIKSDGHVDETLAQYGRNKIDFTFNVTGDFIIVISGNKCSNTGTSHDDLGILNVTWTGYSE